MSKRFTQLASILFGAALMTGCSTINKVNPLSQSNAAKPRATTSVQSRPSLGVNAFLWRASLETLNFMPLDSEDPFGGVIITEWYANPELPTERFKATVYILDTQLRADALKVSIFKQTNSGGAWRDAAIDADTSRNIENAILTRARELFIATN